jgi:hypothetical protein
LREVFEEQIASIFMAEEEAKLETSMKKAALPGLSFSAENGDNLLLQNSG